jgi:hypothetical protein
MADEDLHGHRLQVLTSRRDRFFILVISFQLGPKSRFFILIIPFQLGPKSEPICPFIEYLHKSFSWWFVKNHTISI